MNTATAPANVVLGRGKSVHVAYTNTYGEAIGSLCNPYAWETVRVHTIAADPTCKRCAVACRRAREEAARA